MKKSPSNSFFKFLLQIKRIAFKIWCRFGIRSSFQNQFNLGYTFHNSGSFDTNLAFLIGTQLITILNVNNLERKLKYHFMDWCPLQRKVRVLYILLWPDLWIADTNESRTVHVSLASWFKYEGNFFKIKVGQIWLTTMKKKRPLSWLKEGFKW